MVAPEARTLSDSRCIDRAAEFRRPTRTTAAQVFQDREELATSSNLAEFVRKALSELANLIVICSTNAAKSRWVNEEVRAFCDLGRRDRIQCLIVPEAD